MVFDQSECMQGPSYIINKHKTSFTKKPQIPTIAVPGAESTLISLSFRVAPKSD